MDHPVVIEVTRQQLYEQVWSMPVTKACRTYGLSDVGLAKICEEWDIPRPPRGYWAKKRNGHSVRQKKLPVIEEGNPVLFSYQPEQFSEAKPVREPKPEPTESDLRRKFEKQPENHINVPDTLTDPHPLVARTETSIRSAKTNDWGIARPKARKCLDLAVSPPLIARSLCILDALIKALEARGLIVTVSDDESQRTQVLVMEEKVRFHLYEETVRQERLPTPDEIERELILNPKRIFYTYVSSGKLVLDITDGSGLQRCWTDRSDRRVEQFLNSFVIGIYRVAELLRAERVNAERRRQEQLEAERLWKEGEPQRRKEREEQERLRQEAERLRREEEARVQHLDAEVAAWTKAQKIRAYLALKQANPVGPGG